MRAIVRHLAAVACLAASIAGAPASSAESAGGKAAGTLSFAVYRDFAPFSDAAGENLRGVDVAIAEALAAQLARKPSFLAFDAGENMSDDLRNMVWRGTLFGYGPADVMLHVPVERNFVRANDRALVFAPYYREEYVLAYDPDRLSRIDSVDDLADRVIAAEQGTAAAAALFAVKDGALRQRVRLVASGRDAMTKLLDGTASAAFVTRAQAEAALAAAHQPPSAIVMRAWTFGGLPQSNWLVGMAVKSDNRALADALLTALASLIESGRVRDIFKQHGLSWTAP